VFTLKSRAVFAFPADAQTGTWVRASRTTALIEAFSKVQNEPNTLLISSVPLGVDVCIDQSSGGLYTPLLPPGNPASSDSRYVGRTPVVVPMPSGKVTIIFSYYGALDQIDHGGGIIYSVRNPDPGDYRHHLLFTFRPTLAGPPGQPPWVMRSAIALLQSEQRGDGFSGTEQYVWPSIPCFVEWEKEGAASVRGEMKSFNAADRDVDRSVSELVSRGATVVQTPTGPKTWILGVGKEGTIQYHLLLGLKEGERPGK
jgi:hypothetical protein